MSNDNTLRTYEVSIRPKDFYRIIRDGYFANGRTFDAMTNALHSDFPELPMFRKKDFLRCTDGTNNIWLLGTVRLTYTEAVYLKFKHSDTGYIFKEAID